MTDYELANLCIARFVGTWDHKDPDSESEAWRTPNHLGESYTCERFVRDWRVAGALLERVGNGIEYALIVDEWEASYTFDENYFAQNIIVTDKSLPRAIIEVCLRYLSV